MSEPLWIESLNFSCLSEKFRGIIGLPQWAIDSNILSQEILDNGTL